MLKRALNAKISLLLTVFALLLLAPITGLSPAAFGQGVGSSGEIRGTATDPSGAVLPNVTITATDKATGLQRTATTDGSGQFVIPGLPPATYDVSAKVQGFTPEIAHGVTVSIGETAPANFALKLSSITQEVVVTDEAPVIEADRGSQANTVNEKEITDLPISRRDYLTFSLLMPGVSNSNTIASNADYRVKQTPQSGLSLYGSNGRGNNVTVDGGEFNDDAGGVRLNLSQDAVQEFQINRSNYPASQGGASGAAINIVSKSGGNRAHGGLFLFARNSAMDARNPFSFTSALTPGEAFSLDATGKPIKNSLSREQFGGTIGGPIRKDKTFFFAAFEGLRSDAQNSVPLLTNSNIFAPTAPQLAILTALGAEGATPVPCQVNAQTGALTFLPANLCAFGVQSALTVNPNANPFNTPGQTASDAFVVNQFETNSGVFPFATREYQASGRIDHHFNDSNSIFARYSFAHLRESDPDVQALTAFNRGSSVYDLDNTLQVSYFHQFSPSTSNELHLQANGYEFHVDSNDPGGPGEDVQGYGFFGRNIFLNSHTRAHRYEIGDNVTLVRGRHTLQFGFGELIRANNTQSQTFFGGRFEFLQLPGAVVSLCLQVPTDCGLSASLPGAPITTLQAWSNGAPAFYEQGFGSPAFALTRPFTTAFVQDSWRVRPNLTLNYGLRYELDSQRGVMNTYGKDFGPRVSFAYSPGKDQKTVIRGAYGIFYGQIYFQIPDVVKTLGNNDNTRQIANTLIKITGDAQAPGINSAVIYQTLLAEGHIACGTPAAGDSACITPADLTQFGVNISHSGTLPEGTVLFSASSNYRPPQAQQASFGIERQIGKSASIGANYIYVHTTHLPWSIDTNLLPGAPVVTGVGADGLPTNGLPFKDWGAPACVATPALCFADPTGTILQNNVYSSVANAVYNGGILEFKKNFGEHINIFANYTYSKAIDESTDFNSDFSAFTQTDLRAERARSDFDQRHKVVMAGVLDSPYHSRYLRDFELSPIVSYNSNHPFNLLAGADINGDNHFTNDRPPSAPRNSGIGPNFVTFDARLSRTFRFGKEYGLTFTAEGFNILNRTNFTSVNNIVGSTFGPDFTVHGTSAESPSQPLGYTASAPKRDLQMGARFAF